MEKTPLTSVVQMDTVYNDETTGPFIQIFKFIKASFLFAVLHNEKTAASMVEGVNLLESVLGKELFEKYVQVILTDRGTEFSNPDAMESRSDGTLRTRVFYCDPMRSNQKGSLENKHKLRYICPKQTDLYALGLINQEKMNLVLSHLNSYPLESLAGKTPFEYTDYLFPELAAKFKQFGVVPVSNGEIVLEPFLLKR